MKIPVDIADLKKEKLKKEFSLQKKIGCRGSVYHVLHLSLNYESSGSAICLK